MEISSTYNNNDPFQLTKNLSEHEKNILQQARDFATQILAPQVTQAFREEHFDRKLMRNMGQAGLFKAGITKDYGGSDEKAVAYGLIARELERVDSGYRTLFSVTSSLASRAISLFGTPEQKQKYLPSLAQGELVASFALTEPAHGSDPGGMETHATKKGSHYLLSGQKRWIGLAPYADIFIVWARDQDHVIRGFIVERNTKGVETALIQGKFSLRTVPSGEIIFKDVMIDENQCLAGAKGLAAPFQCLNAARYTIAWGALGAAEACYHQALHYALSRKQFKKPLAANQLVQQKLVQMHTELNLNLLACLHMGRMVETDQASPELISLLKRNCVGKALDIARTARDILGGNGILDEHHIIRHLLNLESVNTYEGTYDIHTLILGRQLTGLQAFT